MWIKQTLRHRFPASEIVTVIYECFFQRPKMRGNRDVKFFNNINPVFICLFVAALSHCHKELKGGEQVGEPVDFKYETAASKF